MKHNLRALTLCQPYAHLIIHGIGGDFKRVENRTWPTHYRGWLMIHAGKSRAWLNRYDGELPTDMVFGAIIGLAYLEFCMNIERVRSIPDDAPFAWVKTHEHTEGPQCWVFGMRVALDRPLILRGHLGLWTPPPHILRPVLRAIQGTLKAQPR